jgi:hypothetical protein
MDFDADIALSQELSIISSRPNDIGLLGLARLLRSEDGGRSWNDTLIGPAQATGSFMGVAGTGTTAVYRTETDLWFLWRGRWTRFAIGDLAVRSLLAIDDEVALLNGSLSGGPVIIRLFGP